MALARQLSTSSRAVCCQKVVHCCSIAAISLAVSILTVWYLNNVVDKGHSVIFPAYDCSSDLDIKDAKLMGKKGFAIDDTTFDCPGEIPDHWPHTDEPVKALRLFRTTQPGWDSRRIAQFRAALASYARRTKAKVLVGTQITCSEVQDDADWVQTLTTLRLLGPDHVLGLAVGNELDQIAYKDGITPDCVQKIWTGYLLNKVHARMDDVRRIPGFEQLPATSVFTAGVVWDTGPYPFKDVPEARVNTFLTQVLPLEPNWVFTLNFYPYFDPTNTMDPDGVHCAAALEKCKCFGESTCLNMVSMIQTRKAITRLTGDPSARFWVGEVGWSSPLASTLHTAVRGCEEFSGYKMLYDYYTNFLVWDLSIPLFDEEVNASNGYEPPEMVFYFSVRDSSNFGNEEHFGLIGKCGDSSCKLNRERAGVPSSAELLRLPAAPAAVAS